MKELFFTFVLSLMMFTFVMLTLNILRELTDLIVNKGVNIVFVGKLLLYLMPYLLTFTIPMSILIAILFVFGRLSADNEITAVCASGVSLYQIVTPVILIALFLSAGSVILNDEIASRAHFAQRKTVAEIGIKNPTAYLEPGKFIKSFDGNIIFVHRITGNNLFNVRIYQPPEEGKAARTIVARRGEFTAGPEEKTVLLELINGSLDEPDPKKPDRYYRVNFEKYNLTLNPAHNLDPARIEKKFKDKTINELLTDIDRMRVMGVIPLEPITEIHYKLALSLASFTFVFIGLPLAVKIRRREKSVGFGLSLGLISIYWIFLAGGKALALRGIMPAALSIWAGNIILSGLGMILLHKVAET